MADKLVELDTRFNGMVLRLVRGLLEISEGENHALDMTCCSILAPVEQQMKDNIRSNQASPEYSLAFYTASYDKHDLIVKQDPSLFEGDGDYFLQLVGAHSTVDHRLSSYLFRRLDSVGQTRLWKWIMEMYRISVVIHIYMSNPTIKEIITVLLKDGTNQGQMMENLVSSLKGKKQLGRLMRQLMRGTDESFQGIIESLRRVIETFCVSNSDSPPGVDPSLRALCSSLTATDVNNDELMQKTVEQLRASGLVQPELIDQLDSIIAGGSSSVGELETVLSSLSLDPGDQTDLDSST